MMKQKKSIHFDVELDENNIPEKITWKSSENKQVEQSKALFIALWDESTKNTLRIDLWDKNMTVDEMKTFVLQQLFVLSETFEKATSDQALAKEIKNFAKKLHEKIAKM